MQYCKNILAIFLLSVYLFSTTGTGELLKLPLLAAHFTDHQQENGQMSVVSFIVMHYITENGTDQDADEDSRLPFNSPDHAIVLSFDSIAPPIFEQLVKPVIELSDLLHAQHHQFLSSQYLASIWQPPRSC